MIASLSSQVSDIQILRPWWKKKLREREPEWTAAKLDRVTTSPRQLLHKLLVMPYARPRRPTALSEPHGFLLLLLSPFVGYEDMGHKTKSRASSPTAIMKARSMRWRQRGSCHVAPKTIPPSDGDSSHEVVMEHVLVPFLNSPFGASGACLSLSFDRSSRARLT